MDIEGIKKFYTGLILQGMISLSILAQIILFLWIFFRKGNPIGSIRRILWLGVHLMADSIGAISLANIFQNSMTPSAAGCQASENDQQIYLLALWATFILLHLGGHNTITAFTLEDNQCWWIHSLKFLFYVGITIIIFLLSVIEERISYCLLLLLFAGISKSCERILAINRGSISRRRRSARKNSHDSPCCSHVDRTDIEGGQQDPDTEDTLREAHKCFESHINIYIDHKTDVNANLLKGLTTEKSIQFLEMELSFAYNMFYSKNVVIDKFWCIVSWLLRFISLFSIIAAGILFVSVERHQHVKIDKAITITLLLKAVILECGSFVVSLLSIDTLVMVAHRPGWIWRKLVSIIIACQNYLAPRTKVGQFNLLSYSSTDRKSWSFVKSLLEIFDFKEFSDNYRYNKYVSLENNQKTLLFDEVSTMRTNPQQGEYLNIFTPIGEKIIKELTEEITTDAVGREELTRFSKRSFEERLLIYHVATELYYDRKVNQGNEIQPEEGNPSLPEQGNVSVEDKSFREVSKILSDYMLYLLVAHPSLLLPVLTPELRSYQDTRAATVKFFNDYCSKDEEYPYEKMIDQYTRFSETDDGGKYKNSVVLDGIKVSKYLTSKRNDNTGRLLCQLWLEMLCFAASQCKGQSHAKQLGKGRELFTIIWLYMIHLGISYESVLQKTGHIFFVPGNQTAMAPQEGQNIPPPEDQDIDGDLTPVTPPEDQNQRAMAPQEGQNITPPEDQDDDGNLPAVTSPEDQNNNEDLTAVTPPEGQNNKDSTGVALQEGQNNITEDSKQEQ